MNSKQFLKWLMKQGMLVEREERGGHKLIRNPNNGKTTTLQMHGSRTEIGSYLASKMKNDLGLK